MQILAVGNEEKVSILRSNSYFSSLGFEAIEALAAETTLRAYKAGEPLFWQGDVCAGLFILRSGGVKLYKLSPKGRELIIRVLDPGATFNEVPVFDHGVNAVNAAALEDSRLWQVPADAIRECLQSDPEMARAVIQNLSQNLRMLVSVVEELSFYQVTSRLARLLCRLTPEQLATQHLTQDQLAARLGTVREVAARSLRELERSGAIRIGRRKIHVLDRQGLEAWAEEPRP